MTRADFEAVQRLVMQASIAKAPLPADPAMVERASELVSGNERLSPVEQLDIYREQFWARHVHSLEDDFIVARHWLGESGFFELASAYLVDGPPRSYDLRSLGARLPAFAASHPRWKDDGALIDALRFDWAYMRAFDAPDAPPFDPATIASAPEEAWSHAKVLLHPSVERLALSFPLLAVREAIRREEKADRPAAAHEHLVVYRSGDWLHCAVIEPMAFELLEALAAGQELGSACEAVATAHGIRDAEVLAPSVGAWFQQWTANGWVSEVRF